MRKARVLILYTGGTFGMEAARGGEAMRLPHQNASALAARMKRFVPELEKLAHCEVEVAFNLDSAHLGPREWCELARRIRGQMKRFDGFVILHGTDTMAYTASALSFLLRPCAKPVVLTGAQRPLAAIRTDARRNLISAVEIAAGGRPKEVTVFFDDKLFQGNRVRKRSASEFGGFESPMMPPIAVVGTSIRFQSRAAAKSRGPKLADAFGAKIAMLHLTPEFPARVLQSALLGKLDALILVAFQSGTAPTHDPRFIEFLKAARAKKLPVILVTEGMSLVRGGAAHPSTYEAGKALLALGCVWGGEMTPECAFVKASWLLAQKRGRRDFVKLWKISFAGEG